MPTWVYCLLSFVLSPTSLVETSSLVLYADSVSSHGYTFSNLFDVCM